MYYSSVYKIFWGQKGGSSEPPRTPPAYGPVYNKSVHTNACNKQSDVCCLSYFHVHTAINILRCFGYPREHNFGLVLILSPTDCTEGCVYFPQSCRNTHLPHFLDCLLNTTLIPCLLVCFLSILHERVCDYSRVQSSVAGILRMGDMNIHITWLTHVRTGPKKKNRCPVAVHCVGHHFLMLYACAHIVSFPNQIPQSLVWERD